MANAGATSSLLAHAAAATSTAPVCPYSTLFFKSARKSTAAGPCHGGRRRHHHRRAMMMCRAAGGGGGDDEGLLLWLPRRDVLTGLTGVAAGLTGYPGLASALEKVCPKGDTVNDDVLKCDQGTTPCPRPPTNTDDKTVDFSLPQDGNVRIRKPVHLLEENEKNMYKRAVALMRDLKPDHPLSFAAQAAIHEAYCDGHYQYSSGNKDRRPFDVHFSWIFAPWHRMYIYFYERALRELLKKDKEFGKDADKFALPYWNWDHPDGMVVPDIFRDGDAASNPLYDANRNLANMDKLVDLDYFTTLAKNGGKPVALRFDQNQQSAEYKDMVYSNLALMHQQQIRGGKGARAFLGEKFCTAASEKAKQEQLTPEQLQSKKTRAQGTLERMAHTTLHVWVGKNGADPNNCAIGHDRQPNCKNDMGFLGSASRDPLFYSHHSNVDRLWHIWSTSTQSKGFPDKEWLDTSFVFYDGIDDPKPVRITVRDVLDATELGYKYSDDDKLKEELPWFKVELDKLVDHVKPSSPRKAPPPPAVKSDFDLKLVKGTPVEVPNVELPKPKDGMQRVLIIDGIDYDPAVNNKFDVAINVPADKAGTVGPTYVEYAGSFSIVPSSKPEGRNAKQEGSGNLLGKVAFCIDEMLKDTGCDKDEVVDIVLVPRTGTGNNCDSIKITVPPVVENFDID